MKTQRKKEDNNPKIELVDETPRPPRGDKYLRIIVSVIEKLTQAPLEKAAKLPIGPEWIASDAASRMSFRTGMLRAGRQTRQDGRQSLSTSDDGKFFYISKREEFDREVVEGWLRRKKKA